MGALTLAVHAGERRSIDSRAVDFPIHLATAFRFESSEEEARRFGTGEGFVYTRWGNPTVQVLQEKIAALEDGESCLATASGMAAISEAILTVAKTGDHVVASHHLYSATYHLLEHDLPQFGIHTTFVDTADPDNVKRAIQKNTKLVYIETPSNPTLQITDLAAMAQLARRSKLMTIVDNTFATPINQHPLSLGIDVVIHSATKYLCGHGDAMGGAIVGRREFVEKVERGLHRDLGGILNPFNAWLIARGARTLPLRVRQHNENAMALASYLATHPEVAAVYYPGLESHPGHGIARRQMSGFGGMLSFEVKDGPEASRRVADKLRLCTLAVSLGDTRTLVTHAASSTHSKVDPETRRAVGISEGLIRVSTGTEDPQDIIDDFEQALK